MASENDKKVKSQPRDILAEKVGFDAKLTEAGFSVGIKSRWLAAKDRLFGGRVDKDAALHETEAARIRITSDVYNKLIIKAGIELEKQIEGNPELAIAILSAKGENDVRQFFNRASTFGYAQEEMPKLIEQADLGPATEEKALDQDWMAQFYTFSGDATSEVLQKALGRILAGETVKPGSFSKKTLRGIVELDTDDANFFQEIARFRNDEGKLLPKPVNIAGDLLFKYKSLEDAGLINDPLGSIGLDIDLSDGWSAYANGDYVLGLKGSSKSKVRANFISITKFGQDLASIFIKETSDLYLRKIYEWFDSDKVNLKEAVIAQITAREGSRLSWSQSEQLFSANKV